MGDPGQEPSPRARALARIASRVVRASSLVAEARLASGVPELDRVLGPAGLARGSLVDLHADEGARALELALALAARLEPAASGRAIVLVDSTGDFYPPAAAQAGIDLERLVVVRAGAPARQATREALAALDEALRSKAVAAAIARLQGLDVRTSHRLRVAAEAGGGVGVLVRPLEERTAVSAAAVRLLLEPSPDGRPRLVPLRVRGAQPPALERGRPATSPGEAAS